MDYRNQMTSLTIKLLLVCALLLIGSGCDKMLPDEYKAQNFSASPGDTLAGRLLTRDTINDAQGNTISYQYYPITSTRFKILPVAWAYSSSSGLSSYATGSDTADNKIIISKFSTIAAGLNALPFDSLVLVNYPAGQAVSYAVLKIGTAEDIHIYTSLQYYWTSSATNINEYVTVDLVKSDTTLVSGSRVISPQDANCALENVLVNGASSIVRVINARLTAHVDPGTYLVRFTLSNPAAISNPLTQPASVFHLPSIARQIKVVILSF